MTGGSFAVAGNDSRLRVLEPFARSRAVISMNSFPLYHQLSIPFFLCLAASGTFLAVQALLGLRNRPLTNPRAFPAPPAGIRSWCRLASGLRSVPSWKNSHGPASGASRRWKSANSRFLTILVAIFLVIMQGAFAQEAAGGESVPEAAHKTLWQVLEEGGPIMIPLAIVSVAMFTLILLGFVTLGRKKLVPDKHVRALRELFVSGDYQSAVAYCKSNPGFFTDTIYTGLLCAGQGKEVAEQAMEDTLAKGVASLSTRNYYLNLIGVVTPMLGLTGTVLGMMSAFSTLGTSGIGDPSALAGAIGEVLVATASGLFIAIPAFTFYYVFRNWITAATAYCEDHINMLFRGMPYDYMTGVYFGEEPIFAAVPNWTIEPGSPGMPATEPAAS